MHNSEAANPFEKFANNIYDVHNLIRVDAVVGRYFGSVEELYANIARCANELRKGAGVATADFKGSITKKPTTGSSSTAKSQSATPLLASLLEPWAGSRSLARSFSPANS